MFECEGCGMVMAGRQIRRYCSNRCQRERERQDRTALWLATGVGYPASAPDHYIRRYLLAEQHECCAVCGLPTRWNDLPLVFVLDHVDGDSTNNRRDNLRLVCPNCDSQLPTFKNRNNGKGRFTRRERYASGKSY